MEKMSVCEANLEAMLKKDVNLIHSIVGKYKIEGHSHDDLFQEGCIGYMNGVRSNSYDSSKAQFSTFITKCITSHLNNIYKHYATDKMANLVTGCFDKLGMRKLDKHNNYDFDEKMYFEQLFSIIENSFDPIVAFIFIDKIRGYKFCETIIRYTEASGKTISRQQVDILFKRNTPKLVKVLKNKGVI